ncbi:hypothetical protein HYU07_02295 [Candidatus Woesearchaeota archaeon]|nr:hypothetical protein [Candidatus Woesearchaeota archaeon]
MNHWILDEFLKYLIESSIEGKVVLEVTQGINVQFNVGKPYLLSASLPMHNQKEETERLEQALVNVIAKKYNLKARHVNGSGVLYCDNKACSKSTFERKKDAARLLSAACTEYFNIRLDGTFGQAEARIKNVVNSAYQSIDAKALEEAKTLVDEK